MWWEFFSKISQIIGRFGQMGRLHCGVFGVFPVELSAHILSKGDDVTPLIERQKWLELLNFRLLFLLLDALMKKTVHRKNIIFKIEKCY